MQVEEYFSLLNQRNMPVIIDNDKSDILSDLHRQGFKTIAFNDFDFQSGQPVFVITESPEYTNYLIEKLWDNHNCILSYMAPWKFYGCNHHTKLYTFNAILQSDMPEVIKERNRVNKKLRQEIGKHLTITGQALQLNVLFTDTVEITNADTVMKPGWNYSTPEFYESALLNFSGMKTTGFTISGSMRFDGAVIIHESEQIREPTKDTLKLFELLNCNGEKRLSLKDNIITQLTIDGKEYTSLVQACLQHDKKQLHPEAYQEGQLKELAFGCNKSMISQVNWSVNSVMNEGIHGLHLGFGLAEHVPHIDFVRTGRYHCED